MSETQDNIMKTPQLRAMVISPSQNIHPPDSVIDIFYKRLNSLYPDIPLYVDGSANDIWKYSLPTHARIVERKAGATKHDFLKTLFDQKTDDDDSLLLFEEALPFLDHALLREFVEEHLKYRAHFTLNENIPAGFLPQILSFDFLSKLPDDDIDLQLYAGKHLNDLDVELFFRLPDLRIYRLNFSGSDERSAKLVLDAYTLKNDLTFFELEDFINKHPQLLRTFPSYFEIELTTRSLVKPDYLYPVGSMRELNRKSWLALLEWIQTDGLTNDATLSIGGRGDPYLHPDFTELLERALTLTQVKRIYIESSGVGLTYDLVEKINNINFSKKIEWIFRITTLKPERYQTIYGENRLLEALSSVNFLKSFPQMKTYVEMVKIKEVEDEVEEFFHHFEQTHAEALLVKFNRYLDFFTERRVSDLTPLHRHFCWHLARDLYLNAEGRVPICREDPDCKHHCMGDSTSESFHQIFERGKNFHIDSFHFNFSSIPLPCEKCDEWFTFNG